MKGVIEVKKEYVKPEVTVLEFSVKDTLMNEEDEDLMLMNDILDGSMGTGGEFDF